MKGSIIGDITGSVWEFGGTKDYAFDLFYEDSFFTDDTILTVATSDVLLNKLDYAQTYAKYALEYPRASWGVRFGDWFNLPEEERKPYNSFGNGSAMRVGPIGWYFKTLEETLEEAKKSAEVTHNHPEGIKGAQSVASAIFHARSGKSKKEIKEYIEKTFEYNLSRTYSEIQPGYRFDVTCQGSVPESIICFLESKDFEDAIRKAVALGGDADTQACITGSIAEAFYGGIPEDIWNKAKAYLPKSYLKVIQEFY